MASLVEYEVLCAVLRDNNWLWWAEQGVTDDHFSYGKAAWQYLGERWRRYGALPDVALFLEAFPDYVVDPAGVGSSAELCAALHEAYAHRLLRDSVAKIEALAEQDALAAAASWAGEASAVLRQLERRTVGMELAGGAPRWTSYQERVALKGVFGISTGLPELDEILGGWEPRTLTTVIARPSEGKTWLLLYWLVQAWMAGKRVLLYSGEMDAVTVGFRCDTWRGHFSNLGLLRGRMALGREDHPLTAADYQAYLRDLETAPGALRVVTPGDLGGRPLTVSRLEALIEQWKPDLIGLDQLSLLEDERAARGDNLRIFYAHLTADLFQLAVRRELPIILLHQAGRAAATDDEEAPSTEHVAESDAILQNSSHLLAFRRLGQQQLKLSVRKNRHGEPGKEILCLWDINYGHLTPVEAALQETSVVGGADIF